MVASSSSRLAARVPTGCGRSPRRTVNGTARTSHRSRRGRGSPQPKRSGLPNSAGQAGRMKRITSKRSGPARVAHSQADRKLAVDRHHQRGRAALDRIGPSSQAINRCKLWQLAWLRLRQLLAPPTGRTNEPHLLTYTARWSTQSVVTAKSCRGTKTILYRCSFRL